MKKSFNRTKKEKISRKFLFKPQCTTETHKPIFRKKLKNRKSTEVKIKKKFPDENMNRYYGDYAKIGKMDIKQQSHQYFPGLTKAADILNEIQNEKIVKDIVEKTNKRKKVLHSDNEGMVKEIYDAKKNLLKDIEKQETL